MENIGDFLTHYQPRLLHYLDANEKRLTAEPDPLEFVEEVLGAWSKFSQENKLSNPDPRERTFWFALYQLEELVENPVTGHIDPYEALLLKNLATARELLRKWKNLPEGYYATRPGE